MGVAHIRHKQRNGTDECKSTFAYGPSPGEQDDPNDRERREQYPCIRPPPRAERALADLGESIPRLPRQIRRRIVFVKRTECPREFVHHVRELSPRRCGIHAESWFVPGHVLLRPHVPWHHAPVARHLRVVNEEYGNYRRANRGCRGQAAPGPGPMASQRPDDDNCRWNRVRNHRKRACDSAPRDAAREESKPARLAPLAKLE